MQRGGPPLLSADYPGISWGVLRGVGCREVQCPQPKLPISSSSLGTHSGPHNSGTRMYPGLPHCSLSTVTRVAFPAPGHQPPPPPQDQDSRQTDAEQGDCVQKPVANALLTLTCRQEASYGHTGASGGMTSS